jgi:hypothetical protein
MRCIVHDPPPADYDTRGQEYMLPDLDALEEEFIQHLEGCLKLVPDAELHTSFDYCGYCYEEYMIRTNGIEGVLLEEAAQDAHILQECTCPADSINRDYFLKALRRARHEEFAA